MTNKHDLSGLPDNLLSQLSINKKKRSWKRDLFLDIARSYGGTCSMDTFLIEYYKETKEVLIRGCMKAFLSSLVLQGYFNKLDGDNYEINTDKAA